MTVTVRDVIAALKAAYPPRLAESWDAVGLVCGDPAEPVRRVLVDVAHWASEHPWCVQAAAVVSAALGGTVDVHVSYRRTDPWMIGAARPAGRPLR